jgi:hypothetical protein
MTDLPLKAASRLDTPLLVHFYERISISSQLHGCAHRPAQYPFRAYPRYEREAPRLALVVIAGTRNISLNTMNGTGYITLLTPKYAHILVEMDPAVTKVKWA